MQSSLQLLEMIHSINDLLIYTQLILHKVRAGHIYSL